MEIGPIHLSSKKQFSHVQKESRHEKKKKPETNRQTDRQGGMSYISAQAINNQ